jgi:hypothetical protein
MTEHGRRGTVTGRLRWAGIGGTILVLAALTAVAVQGQSPAPSPSGEVLPGEPNPPWDDGALPATIDPNLVNVHPRTWEHVLVGPDGRTANVYFWNGVPECYGLADVQVTSTDTGVRILVFTGEVEGADACVDLAQLYRTVVVFDERVIEGGDLLDLPSGSARGV